MSTEVALNDFFLLLPEFQFLYVATIICLAPTQRKREGTKKREVRARQITVRTKFGFLRRRDCGGGPPNDEFERERAHLQKGRQVDLKKMEEEKKKKTMTTKNFVDGMEAVLRCVFQIAEW